MTGETAGHLFGPAGRLVQGQHLIDSVPIVAVMMMVVMMVMMPVTSVAVMVMVVVALSIIILSYLHLTWGFGSPLCFCLVCGLQKR